MSSTGRLKGKAFERETAIRIREIFGLDDKEVYRTPNSGGFANTQRSDISIREDILVEQLPISVECKWYKDWTIAKMVQLTTVEKSWHAQCLTSTALTQEQFKKRKNMPAIMPILACKGNNRAPWMFTRDDHALAHLLRAGLLQAGEPYMQYQYGDALWFGSLTPAFLTWLQFLLKKGIDA
jgi:hypothetical protein